MSAAVETLESGASRDSLAVHLANFAASFSLEHVPGDVVEYAKLCIADTIGIGFASHRYPFASASLNGIRALASDGDFPVVGTELRLAVRDAAMANGLLMHGLDYDDTHTGAVIHCSTSAVPLMLTEAQRRGASGPQALAAYLLAIETDARIGMVAEGMLQKIGFHPTGLVGIFGCAVAAGYLGGLSPTQIAMAQGVALSMASGSLEFLEDGSWTKRLHPGWAAASAIQAVSMAEHNFKAPLNAYEGRYGLYSLYLRADKIDTRETAATLGSVWEMNKVAIKPYPICHFNHASVDAMLELVRQHNLAPDDIASATVLLHDKQHDVVCRPEAAKRRPQNDYDAKFSVHFAVAAAAVRQRFTLDELADDALNDPAILALADRMTFRHDDESRYPEYYSGGVIVTTRDGRTLEHREPVNRGADSRRLTATDVRKKFMANTDGHLSATAATELWDAIQSLDNAADLNAVTTRLRSEA
ncbi:MAG: MmgE/PrpD family protein [Pseudomonadota bacterium]